MLSSSTADGHFDWLEMRMSCNMDLVTDSETPGDAFVVIKEGAVVPFLPHFLTSLNYVLYIINFLNYIISANI